MPSVLRAGRGLELVSCVPDVELPEGSVASVFPLTFPDSPSPDTDMSLTESMSLPVTCIPTLLSKPQLLGPDAEQTAVTVPPLIA